MTQEGAIVLAVLNDDMEAARERLRTLDLNELVGLRAACRKIIFETEALEATIFARVRDGGVA